MSITRPAMNIVSQAGRFFVVLLLVSLILVGLLINKASAFDYPKLYTRSLRLGTVVPGTTTNYTFSWKYLNSTSVRSVRFFVCADPYVLDTCSGIPPIDMSAALLTSQAGVTGFSILNQSANEITMTRVASAASTVQSTYVFDDVVNPTGLATTFFVQIFTYPTADASGTPNHISSVANATTTPININTEVPPILYFCAALTVDEWCENVAGNFINYADLSSDFTDVGVSQFGVATNASGGYVVTVNGNTMAAGNKIIDALTTSATNSVGTSQFGLNLRANTDPAAGQDAFGPGIGTVDSNYDVADQFRFNDGETVASAVTGTLFNTFTVTYIVNVPPDQPSGVYNTTIAYICTAAF